MFAVVKTGGKQYKVKENDIILVEKLENKKGDSINLNQILLLSNDEKKIQIGTPLLNNKLKFDLPQFGDFFSDMVLFFKFDKL